MSNLKTFNFQNSDVRVELKNNEPLFCLTDVANILNIQNTKSSRFQLDTKGVHKMYTLTAGGKQELTFIDEPNLYRVLFRSNKKEAVEFQNWIFNEVLPSIRKTGQYSVDTQQLNELNRRIQAIEDKACTPSSTSFSDIELCHLAWAYLVGEVMRTRIEEIYPILRQLGSDLAPSFYSMAYEYKENLEDTRIILERSTQHINPQQQGCYQKNWETVLSRLRRRKKS